jgi:Holliday junction resolvasome RuvABC endonuclease subunit
MTKRIAMGVDFSTLALHVSYGPGPTPYHFKLTLTHLDPEDRIYEVYEKMTLLYTRIKRRWPDLEFSVLVVERPFLGKGVTTLRTLTQVQSAILLAGRQAEWYTVQEDPSVIRKNVLGQGTAKGKGEIKRIGQAWVKATHQIEVDLDTADSIVIWSYAKWLTDNLTSLPA